MTRTVTRTDRIVLALAVFGVLAALAVSTGPGAEFLDAIEQGLNWLGEHRKGISALNTAINIVTTVAKLLPV